MKRRRGRELRNAVCLLVWLMPAVAQPVMEHLDRGMVAVRDSPTRVYVSWRLLGTDPPDVAFNLYRASDEGRAVKLNAEPLTRTTDFVDETADFSHRNVYFVQSVPAGAAVEPNWAFVVPANAPIRQYLEIALQSPPDANLPDGSRVPYEANDASVADLTGNGQYEIILKWEAAARDPARPGYSGETVLDAYKLDGTLLWRIRLGRNIRSGAHYTPFIVYDLDGDGRAEVAIKTADGTIDGKGKVIGDPEKDWVSSEGPTLGKVLAGPEYLTIFDGRTGAALATTSYVPDRGAGSRFWGGVGGSCGADDVGNRMDRFLAGVAYLDGRLPSLLMTRGYYGRSVIAAWDWRSGKLSQRWVFDSASDPALAHFSGQGNHSLSIADVDGDGKDEIIYGAMVVDDDGKGLFSTGFRHGDALHAGAFLPDREGLQVFGIHENERPGCPKSPGMALFAANDGEILFHTKLGEDVGRGIAADIDPRHPGAEFWGGTTEQGPRPLLDAQGNPLGPAPSTMNFAVWWDADLLRELLDQNWIAKWDYESGTLTRLLTAEGAVANNGSKATPVLSADLLGDWREEVIWRTADNRSLRIYTTTIPAESRMVTLMHDPQYRVAVAWQNVGYNQPPHPGFYLGTGMKTPTRHAITTPRQVRRD